MGTVQAQANMSLDGHVAKQDNTIGRLFDWLQNGEVADFADGSSFAYLETGLRGMVMQDTEDVTALEATWDRLAAEALPRSASVKLIEEVAQEWNR